MICRHHVGVVSLSDVMFSDVKLNFQIRPQLTPCRSPTYPVSQSDKPMSQRDAPRVAASHTPCRSVTHPVRSATHPVSQCDIPRAAARHTPCRSATHPASQRDKPASQRDIPRVAARHVPRPSATRTISRCVGPPSGRATENNLRAPLTSLRDEPKLAATNLSLERGEGLAANGGTRVLNKDSEVRTECGS